MASGPAFSDREKERCGVGGLQLSVAREGGGPAGEAAGGGVCVFGIEVRVPGTLMTLGRDYTSFATRAAASSDSRMFRKYVEHLLSAGHCIRSSELSSTTK